MMGGGHCAGQMRALQMFTSFFSNNKGGFYVQVRKFLKKRSAAAL